MEVEEAQCNPSQANQQNIPNNQSTIHRASDEYTKHASKSSNDNSSNDES